MRLQEGHKSSRRKEVCMGYDNYGKCKKCRYADPTERNGYKWYCEYYKTYEDPDEVKECKHFNEG